MYLVTVKLPSDLNHDPHNKVTGKCPVPFNFECTDVTGQHHTFLSTVNSKQDVIDNWGNEFHITRIEEV